MSANAKLERGLFLALLESFATTETQKSALNLYRQAVSGDSNDEVKPDKDGENVKDGQADKSEVSDKDADNAGDAVKSKDGKDGKQKQTKSKDSEDEKDGDEQAPKWAQGLLEKVASLENQINESANAGKKAELEKKVNDAVERGIKSGIIPAKDAAAKQSWIGALNADYDRFAPLLAGKGGDDKSGKGDTIKPGLHGGDKTVPVIGGLAAGLTQSEVEAAEGSLNGAHKV